MVQRNEHFLSKIVIIFLALYVFGIQKNHLWFQTTVSQRQFFWITTTYVSDKK